MLILLLPGARNIEKWFHRECRWASLEGTGTAPIPGIPLPPAASAEGTKALDPDPELSGCSNFDALSFFLVRYVQQFTEHCVTYFIFVIC
jgi:hypothetical protein